MEIARKNLVLRTTGRRRLTLAAEMLRGKETRDSKFGFGKRGCVILFCSSFRGDI